LAIRVLDALTDYMCTLCPPLRHLIQFLAEHLWPLLERIYLNLLHYFLAH